MIEKEVVLEVKNLKKYFPASHKRVLKAVDDVSFTIHKGETFGIVENQDVERRLAGKPVPESLRRQTDRCCIREKMCIR